MAIREYIVKITDEVIPDGFERFENEYAPEGQLVRCKNCENWLCVTTPKNHRLTKCFLHEQFEPNGEWFCAAGRKKDD